MKQSASFSGNEFESISLDFAELRERGLKYVQELSGDIWTDYNSHDPGVTILEQLCYALTDAGYRTSLNVKDLLIPGKGLPIDVKSNAFFSPSSVFSSHPVTINDIRKMIIDHFDQIQNVWIITKGNNSYQEELRGVNKIEILPKISFLNTLKSNPREKGLFLYEVNDFLRKNRNLGEKYEAATLLEKQFVQIEFDVHINEYADLDSTLANVLLKLFEFIYSPVHFYSFNEMREAEIGLEEIFSGPLLKKGFLKNELHDERIRTIRVDELQKLFSKIKGIKKCNVRGINYNGKKYLALQAEKGKFFHLLMEKGPDTTSDKKYESIYSNMNIFINNKRHLSINKQRINNFFLEIWSKKNRGYSLNISEADFFQKKQNGKFRNPGEYFSVQKHFPIIYGIGEEGLSRNEPVDRHAKALQLKAYLLLAEQHLANHLSQLRNLNEFFNIDFENGRKKTYFPQKISSVPNIDKLLADKPLFSDSDFEPEYVFYNRKNRIYDHLLARFGEGLNDVPWQISLRLNIIKTVNEFNHILLREKSDFLMHLEKLSYNRSKGESFDLIDNEKIIREPSGLEQILLVKTGIPQRENRILSPDFPELNSYLYKQKEETFKSEEELFTHYRPLRENEINKSYNEIGKSKIPNALFGEIGIKKLFKETLNYGNYRLSIPLSTSDNVHVIFQKEPNKWVRLFEPSSEKEAVRNILRITDFFIEKNFQSEGLYLIDHILLSDFIEGSKYGFCFLDEYGNPHFRTIEDDSWCASEEERNIRVAEFFEYGISEDSYFIENGKWKIKNKEGSIIATIDSNTEDTDGLFKQTKSMIHLFGDKTELSGRMRLQEVEKIRLKGSNETRTMNFGQRRLVFQRKLTSKETVNEDFFDLKISLLLPDWPARFQEERFKEYITDVFLERIPAHLSNEIFWLDVNKMKTFEKKYESWAKLKARQKFDEAPSESLKNAAYEVFKEITNFKRTT